MKQLLLTLSLLSLATPAFAEFTPREKRIRDYSYSYGWIVAMCGSYSEDDITLKQFRRYATKVKYDEDITPKMWTHIVDAFRKGSKEMPVVKKCYSVVKDL